MVFSNCSSHEDGSGSSVGVEKFVKQGKGIIAASTAVLSSLD